MGTWWEIGDELVENWWKIGGKLVGNWWEIGGDRWRTGGVK